MIMTGQGFATGIWWVEVWESAKHFTLFRTGTLQKLIGPKCASQVVQR